MNKSKARAMRKTVAKFRRRLEKPTGFRPSLSAILSFEYERRRKDGQRIPNRAERRRNA